VADADVVNVTLHDKRVFKAKVIGRDPNTDVAVIKIEGKNLPTVPLGDDTQEQVGDWVLAIGNPLSLQFTVTAGIISAKGRSAQFAQLYNNPSYAIVDYIQTDAAINPGNSGGPLVDLSGRVVGVNSAIATTGGSSSGEAGNIGVGFAIPIDQVKITADQILRTGEARYPVIGATVDTAGIAPQAGAQILKVNAGSPAAKAGLRKGDVVTAVAGEKVTDGVSLIVAIRAHQPGDTVRFTVRRGGSQTSLKITLGSQVG